MVKLFPAFLAALACSIVAAAPHKVALHRQVRGSYKDMAASEGSRWAKKAALGVHVPAINDFFKYNIEVSIGHPAQSSYPIFDTGSPFLWVGNQFYDVSKSAGAHNLNFSITLPYAAGNVTIDLYNDTISLGKNLTTKQELGVTSNMTALQLEAEGVFGFGPDAMAVAYTKEFTYIPTAMQNLVASHEISNLFAVDFRPLRTSKFNVANGQIDIGELDRSKFTGDIIYSPISQKSPFKYFWSTDVPNIKFDGKPAVSNLSAIFDTGTPFIMTTLDILQKIFSDIEGLGVGGTVMTVPALDGKVMTVPESQVHKLKDVTFELAGGSIVYKPEQYLVPSFLEPDFGATGNGTRYTFFGVFGGFGLPLIIGESLMEHYYTIFDGVHQRVGFATKKVEN